MLKVIAPLAAVFVLGFGAGCTTNSNTPADPHLSGPWQLDKAASDNADDKISAAVSGADVKLRRKLANAGFDQYAPEQSGNGGGRGRRDGGGGSANAGSVPGSGELNGDEYSTTGFIGPDFHELRSRLKLVLTAPQSLSIDVQPDSVRFTPDSVPSRDYSSGDEFTRMDEYGTAQIDTKWSGKTFILRARYSNHATVIERYSAEPQAGTMTVIRDLTDPVVGKLAVRAVYRRGPTSSN